MASTSPDFALAQSYMLFMFFFTASGQLTIRGCPVQPLPDQVLPSASFSVPVSALHRDSTFFCDISAVP